MSPHRLAGALLVAGSAAVLSLAAAEPLHGELRLQYSDSRPAGNGPLAQAHRLSQAVPDGSGSAALAEAELSGRCHAVQANLLLQQDVANGTTRARLNELYVAHDSGAWGLSAGKRILGWDVGQAFRPNDLVQQEVRRALFPTTLEGRELLQAEHFGAASSTSLVWLPTEHRREPTTPGRDGTESAWAARHYARLRSADLYGYARVGRRSGPTLGASAAWVHGEAWGFTASARWLQRHAPAFDAAGDGWAGAAWQAMAGLTWTGDLQQSVMVEAWHDGSAPRDADWQRWAGRNAAVTDAGAWAAQAAVLQPNRLRQDNLFLRTAWQPGAWTWSADLLWMPADQGRIFTLSGQWQGDRWRLYGAWRRNSGPAEALAAQLPQRQSGLVAAVWAF